MTTKKSQATQANNTEEKVATQPGQLHTRKQTKQNYSEPEFKKGDNNYKVYLLAGTPFTVKYFKDKVS